MSYPDDAAHLTTEARNPASVHLDRLSTLELVELMNREDGLVIPAVAAQASAIARAIDVASEKLQAGGRLIYLGAGTSGRLGVLDASECPPTFRTRPELVVGVIAGGSPALTRAIEGAEDDPAQAVRDLEQIQFTGNDVLVGISTSGRTPYVLGGITYARQLGALTVGISCNAMAVLAQQVDIAITPVVGPEVLSGSTRLKAGTATKLVLNILSTGTMIKLGKTFGNLMVDLKATNSKLLARARRIVQTVTTVSPEEAQAVLEECQGEVKTAIVVILHQTTPDDARNKIQQAQGHLGRALQNAGQVPCQRNLILGIDGGGTGTTALLAEITENGYRVLGRGEAGPSNRQAVGDSAMCQALQSAVNAAFASANLPISQVGAACLGMAGADRPGDRAVLEQWAKASKLAESIKITNDAELVLAAGTPEGWGLAIIAGTGSIAYGKSRAGQVARAGGWGYLMGDKGSAYSIAVDALQVAAIEIDTELSLDGELITDRNALLPLLMSHWKLDDPRSLVHQVYGSGMDRAALAQLAPLIMTAHQEGNTAPTELIDNNAMHLAGDAAIVMRKLFDQDQQIPIALAGGLFTHFAEYAEKVETMLKRCRASEENPEPVGPVEVVHEPAEGALKLAALLLKV